MRRTLPTLALLLLAGALLAPASALAGPDEPPPEEPKAEDRERMREQIRIVRAAALTEALDLDEATAARLFPYLLPFDKRTDELHDEKRRHRKALRKMVLEDRFEEPVVDEHLAALGELDVQMAQIRSDQLAGLGAILTPEQRVKFLMVQRELEDKVRRVIREERRERRERHEHRERRRGE